MQVEIVEAKINNGKHLLKGYDFKGFQIRHARINSRNFKLIHDATNTKGIQTIWFNWCRLVEFPRAEILLDLVENLTFLSVSKCDLTQITSDNLQGLGSLKELYLSANSIESLPKDLFVHTPKLEIVSFWQNRIKEIDENILVPFKNLKYFDLRDNLKINVRFDSINGGNVTLARLKEEIKKCRPSEDLRQKNDELKNEFDRMQRENIHIKTENHNLRMINEVLRKEVCELKTNCAKLIAERNQQKDANFKPFNFTVVVNEKDFNVNKVILVANSPVLAKLIKENPDVDSLVLRDVSEETFEEIYKFMMTKNSPSEATNLIELYAASARLEMKDLMKLTAEILMGKITTENAPDIMKMSLKFNHVKLTKKVLSELNKIFCEN